MLSKIIKFLFILIAVGLVTVVLYILDLPPFQPYNSSTPNSTTEQNSVTEGLSEKEKLDLEKQNLPDELKENRIARQKTYEELMARGSLLENNNFPTLAIAEYQEAYNKNSSRLEPLLQIGRIHLREKNYNQAVITFQNILEKSPQHNDAKVYLARTYLAQREISKADQILTTINQHNYQSKYYQGIIAAYLQKNDDAKRLLNEALDMSPNEDIRRKAENFLNAYNEYGFNVEAPTVHLKVLIARSLAQTGEYQMAIPLLFEVTKEKSDYRDAWIVLGYAYLNIEKYQDAIEALERAKILDPQKAETLFYLGLAYYAVNDFKQAETALVQAKENGYQPRIQIDQKLAEIYLQLQNFNKSAASYENVISVSSQDLNYFVKPIWIYLEKTNQTDKAYLLAEKALKENPKAAMSHNLMGWVLIYQNQFDRAESHLKLAMTLDPELDAVYLNFGQLLEKKNQNLQAINFYKKAHKLGQGNGVSNTAAEKYNLLIEKQKSSENQIYQANTFNN